MDPRKLKQRAILEAHAKAKAKRFNRSHCRFSESKISELNDKSDQNILWFYRKELLKMHLTGKNQDIKSKNIVERLRSMGIIEGYGGKNTLKLSEKALDIFRRKRWTPRHKRDHDGT